MVWDQEKRVWQLNRHMPSAVLLTILVQTMMIVGWANRVTATTETKLQNVERQLDSMKDTNERLAKLEVISSTNSQMLHEIRAAVLRER